MVAARQLGQGRIQGIPRNCGLRALLWVGCLRTTQPDYTEKFLLGLGGHSASGPFLISEPT
jgi:hypothetical protein